MGVDVPGDTTGCGPVREPALLGLTRKQPAHLDVHRVGAHGPGRHLPNRTMLRNLSSVASCQRTG
jgi:hypothetical protein